MTRVIGCALALVVVGTLAARVAHAQSADSIIAAAVLPLPEDLRAGATVVTYDPATGARKVIRQGTNAVECQPKNPTDGFTRCYNKALGPRRDLEAKLHAEKKSDKEIQDAVAAAVKAGTIKAPTFGMMSYRLSSDDGRIKRLWVMSVPNATPESIGVSTVSQRDAALKGEGLPWLMLPGTPGAHVMIPINTR
ncbi:MAG TPA: hypothetical protein VGY48_31105 [Vicinamibacterales bacterium]|jgi:hypothetical protein|nr:hypothetical protein [Vicinamibacterales bacterium]